MSAPVVALREERKAAVSPSHLPRCSQQILGALTEREHVAHLPSCPLCRALAQFQPPLQLSKVPGDGSCLFSAFAIAMRSQGSASYFRAQVVEFLEKLKQGDDLFVLVHQNVASCGIRKLASAGRSDPSPQYITTIAEYRSYIACPNAYGGDVDILILSYAFNARIFLFKPDTGILSPTPMQQAGADVICYLVHRVRCRLEP